MQQRLIKKQNATKLCGGVEVELHSPLISAPDGRCPPHPDTVLWYLLGRRLCGPEGLSGCVGKDKMFVVSSHMS